MIRFPRQALPAVLLDVLATRQEKIDKSGAYTERVTTALAAWKSKPSEFKAVRNLLRAMCSGSGRCMYCEDSLGDEIEHYRPKALYPELTFAWRNFLLSCGTCNGPAFKGDAFGVVSWRSTGTPRQYVELAPPSGGKKALLPRTAPPPGTAMLINPRMENPLRLLRLDLFPPFHFRPARPDNCLHAARAAYTIETLGLNRRDELISGRDTAYGNYCSEIEAYTRDRAMGTPQDTLARRIKRISKNMSHRTVLMEMQRQHLEIAELRSLFEGAPEALHW
jgi:hypothetical protein